MKNSKHVVGGIILLLCASACSAEPTKEAAGVSKVKLAEWYRGVSLTAPDDPEMTLYLWFYEWNVFNAAVPTRHSPGPQNVEKKISEDGQTAWLASPGVRLTVESDSEGASLALTVTNNSMETWPAAAGIIPCLNPGDPPEVEVKKNLQMMDMEQSRTWFMGASGPEKLIGRDLHFIERKLDAVKEAAPEGMANLFPKWPVSQVNALEGVLFRESTDGKWIAGIGWEDVIFVQGHNPWKCMHVCVGVGPLAPGESKTIRGRIWLFQGMRDEAFVDYAKQWKR